MKNVRIRPATRDDRNAIEQLVESGAKDVRKHIGPHPAPVKIADLAVRGCEGLVAVSNDQVIGSVAYRIRGGRLHLFNLVVQAKHRGNGVARRLILELEKLAGRDGAKHVTLQAIEELGVVPMFQGFGYRVQSAKREFLFTPQRDRALTTVYMVKRLSKPSADQTGK